MDIDAVVSPIDGHNLTGRHESLLPPLAAQIAYPAFSPHFQS